MPTKQCFKTVNRSVSAYRNCVEHYLGSDRFQQAAKLEEEIGDMFAEDEKYKEAMECYEKAADYFRAENDQAFGVCLCFCFFVCVCVCNFKTKNKKTNKNNKIAL